MARHIVRRLTRSRRRQPSAALDSRMETLFGGTRRVRYRLLLAAAAGTLILMLGALQLALPGPEERKLAGVSVHVEVPAEKLPREFWQGERAASGARSWTVRVQIHNDKEDF